MANAFIGEIRIFGGDYEPEGWLFCNGQKVSISAQQALYSLIGTIYGGDGQSNFAVPNMNGSLAIGMGLAADFVAGGTPVMYNLGTSGGSEVVQLASAEMPKHTHQAHATTNQASSPTPGPTLGYSSVSDQNLLNYTDTALGVATTTTALGMGAVSVAGGPMNHNNMMPSMALNYIICCNGIYPTSM
jgi:microcystin-dependent protein